jgi:hypothetical protein
MIKILRHSVVAEVYLFSAVIRYKIEKLRILLSASNVLGPANFSGNVFATLRFDSKSGSNSAFLDTNNEL